MHNLNFTKMLGALLKEITSKKCKQFATEREIAKEEAICNYLQSIIVCSFEPRFLKSIVQYINAF